MADGTDVRKRASSLQRLEKLINMLKANNVLVYEEKGVKLVFNATQTPISNNSGDIEGLPEIIKKTDFDEFVKEFNEIENALER